MKFIHHSELDKKRWDALVEQCQADVFSHSWYLDACAQDWCVLMDENLENGIALPFTVKLGIKAVSPPIFIRNLDFIGNDKSFPPRALKFIRDQFHTGHLQLSFLPSDESVFPASGPLSPQFARDRDGEQQDEARSRVHQVISVPAPVNQQARRMIQKAEKNDISIRQTEDWRAVVQVIREELSEKISEFTPENLDRLEKLVASLEMEGKLYCLGIYTGGVLEGGMIFMDSAAKRIYLKGASSRSIRDFGGMYLCMKEAIGQAVAENRTFDFGGSEVEGVRRFNLNLGGTDRPYYIYSWNRAPWWFNLTKSMYQKWKKK